MKTCPTAVNVLAVIAAAITSAAEDGREVMLTHIQADETIIFSRVVQLFDWQMRHNTRCTVVTVSPAHSREEDMIVKGVQSRSGNAVYVRDNACNSSTGKCTEMNRGAREVAGFIIVSHGADEDFLMEAASQLSETVFWDNQARFLLVLTSVVRGSTALVERVLRRYWTQYEVLNCVAVFMFGANSSWCDARALCFNPFSNGGSFVNCSDDLWKGNVFKDTALDVNGFPLRVSMKHFPPFAYADKNPEGHVYYGGVFVTMFGFALKQFNSRIVNSEVVHLLNTSEWCVPDTFFTQPDADDLLHYVTTAAHAKVSTYPLVITNLIFLVPKSQMIPFWKNTFLPFTLGTWTSYWSFVASVIFVSALAQCLAARNFRRFNVLEIIRAMFFGTFVHKLQRTSERLFFISLLLFNIIFNNAYAGCFTSFKVVPRFYADINSLHDLQTHSLKVAPVYNYGGDVSYQEVSLDEYILEWYDEITDWLLANVVVVEDINEGIDMVIKHRNLSLVTEETYALYLLNQRKYTVGRYPILHIPKITILPLLGGFRVRSNFPFFKKFDFALTALCENGIAEHVKGELFSEILSKITYNDEVGTLTYNHFRIFFYVFCSGCCSSVIVFIVEILVHSKLGLTLKHMFGN